MNESRAAVFKVALLLALTGLAGLILAFVLSLLSQPSYIVYEKTIELNEPITMRGYDFIEEDKPVSRITVTITNKGNNSVFLAHSGEHIELTPGESVSFDLKSLYDVITVSGLEARDLKVAIRAEIQIVEGGSIILLMSSLVVFLVSALMVMTGTSLLFSLARRP